MFMGYKRLDFLYFFHIGGIFTAKKTFFSIIFAKFAPVCT